MSHSGGGYWGYVALLAVFACSSPVPPPAEGSATVNGFCSYPKVSISGLGGDPTSPPLQPNQTVLEGRSGFEVSCSVKATGGGNFAISGSIASRDMALTISSGDVSAATSTGTAKIYIWTAQSLKTISSETLCTITATSNTVPGVFKVEPGSIWAEYRCTGMKDNINLSSVECSPRGEIVLTGCER